jgi:hypothetical protein
MAASGFRHYFPVLQSPKPIERRVPRRRPDVIQKRIDKLVRGCISLSAYIGTPITIETAFVCDVSGRPNPSRIEIDGVGRTYHIEPSQCCRTELPPS